MKLNLSTRIKIIIYTAGGVLVLLIVGFFAVWPAISEIRLINEQILTERKALEKKYKQGQSLRQATEEYLKIKDDFSEILKAFVIKNEELEFITKIESLADKHQIEQGIKISPEIEYNKDFEKLPLSLTLHGSYQNLLQYLNELESLSYYTNFSSLNLQTTKIKSVATEDETSLSPQMKLILDINVFRKK